MNNPTSNIADFTDAERKLVSHTLFERYGRLIGIQSADAEIELIPESGELMTCPVLYWEDGSANFVVFKTGASQFRCQFFYVDAEQYGTGRDSYDNLGDCVVTLLQVQTEHERSLKALRSSLMSAAQDNDDPMLPVIVQ